MQKESDIRDVGEGDWRCFSRVMSPGRIGLNLRVRDAGSYSHAVNDTTEVQRVAYGRVFEGEVGDTDIQGVFTGEADFTGRHFLGSGQLCQYSRFR